MWSLGDNRFHTMGGVRQLKRSENLPDCWEALAKLSYSGVWSLQSLGGILMAYHTIGGQGGVVAALGEMYVGTYTHPTYYSMLLACSVIYIYTHKYIYVCIYHRSIQTTV